LEASRNIGLEVNAEKTKYMIMSLHPNSGQNQNIRTANESFGKVAKFKYLGTTLTNQNDIHGEIKSTLNSGNACYYSVQNLFSFPSHKKRYGCETWSLTLREEHRLRVFENRVLKKIFGPKREEDGSWRKLHNDELHSLYSSPNNVRVIKSRSMRWAGHVARMGEGKNIYRILVGRPEGKRPLGRSRRRWEDNIKLDIGEIGVDGANWIHLTQDRGQSWDFVNTVMNFRVP
jgi:hypothetical protein